MICYMIGWGIAFVIFAIIEGMTTQLVSIWFALGSLAAFIAATLNTSLPVQLIVFVCVTAVALLATRPLARRIQNKKKVPTNADRIIGQIGYVIEAIDNFKEIGRVKVDNQVWSARTVDGAKLEAGTTIAVKRIEGVKLMVSVAIPEDYEELKTNTVN